jgi:hypothetical protein
VAPAISVKHISDDGGKELIPQQFKQFGVVCPFHASSSVTEGGGSMRLPFESWHDLQIVCPIPEASQHIETD